MKPFLHYLVVVLFLISLGSRKKDKTPSCGITGSYLIAGRAMSFTVAGAKTSYHSVRSGELRKYSTQGNHTPPAEIGQFRFTVVMPAASYVSVADFNGGGLGSRGWRLL